MNSCRCPHCGLVNFSTSETCKRCSEPLFAEPDAHETMDPQSRYWAPGLEPEKPPIFSGVVMVLTGMLAIATIVLLIQQVGHPLDKETAGSVGVLFGLAGAGLYFMTHIWLLIRIFEQSIGWGIASLCLPFAQFGAIAKFWDTTRRSFVGQMICLGILFVGIAIGI